MKGLKWLIGLIPIIGIIVTIILISRSNQELIRPSDVSSAMSSAEGAYFMENMISTNFDVNGKQSYVMQSPRVDHFPEESRSEIYKPTITFNRPEGPPWLLSAEKATAQHPSQEMLMVGQVRLHRRAEPPYAEVEMTTDSLVLNAQTRQAKSDYPVRFNSTQGYVSGVGLRADLATEQLKLLSNVEGEYVQETR